ncbi:gliding motility lipoprotein GldB [Pedobacter montanisoli]|uniref:Gliding motility lipoprotein GldB n=1 Tax=Pedobacter montanisoli TaxID=2923277 RepID=A0ABS9ZRK4_9SPHI|nr:gliding motility lipoprotein GldB [Pedobacter montanisoli]MCJ0741216.1 gliding motility lipoprotein GldB [Pedobacter montanisoli]
MIIKKSINWQSYLFFLCAIVFFSCKNNKKPDVNNIQLAIKVERFDRDLYAGKEKDILATNAFLEKKYGSFYDDFIHQMVGNSSYTGPTVLESLYKNKAYTDLTQEVDSVFPNLNKVNEELTQTFKYIKYYYPKAEIPRFIAFVSGFAYQTPIGDNYLGIGLDMFLGKDSKFYGALIESLPQYLTRKFTPDYIVPRVSEYYVRENLIKEQDQDRSLLSKMIYNGKILYFMEQVLPETTPDSVKIGYTTQQLAWCKTFEPEVWAYFMENNLLYNTDYSKIQVYLSDGPFTPGIGEKRESAPKLGVWIGWQIVKQYMKQHPDVTLNQLMAEKDAQKILSDSKYKPKG